MGRAKRLPGQLALRADLDWQQRRRGWQRLTGRAIQGLRKLWRPVRRRLWPGAPSTLLLVLVFILVTLGLSLSLYLSGWYSPANTFCDDNVFWCGLGIHVVGTGIVGVLVYYFVFLRREDRAARKARLRAKSSPEELFSWLPPKTNVGEIVGREQLVKEIASDLDQAASPQLIVGGTGTGKTMVLLGLTKFLAKQRQVAVPLSLRTVPGLNFAELAREAFVDQIKAEVRSRDDADKVWRWLLRRQLVTVLADDFEKADVERADKVRALTAARRERLRLVVASRPDGVPADLEESVIELEPLSDQDVVDYIAERLRQAPGSGTKGDAEGEVRPVVQHAKIGDTPYYIGVAGRLAEIDALPRVPDSTTIEARRLLLNAYHVALADRKLLREAGFSPDERKHILKELELVAYARLHGPRQERELQTWLEEHQDKRIDMRLTGQNGVRLGVLEPRDDDEIRFGHPTTLAYFAAAFLAGHKEKAFWRSFINHTPAPPTVTLAIVLANAAAQDADFARATCEALVAQSADQQLETERDSEGSVRLSLIAAAAEAAKAAELPELGSTTATPSAHLGMARRFVALVSLLLTGKHGNGGRKRTNERVQRDIVATIIEGARHERLAASRLSKLRAIPAIAGLGTDSAYTTLWEYASADEEYTVRRAATMELVRGGAAAFNAIEPSIEECFREAEGLASGATHGTDERNDHLLNRLKVLGWTLPSLRTAFARDHPARTKVLDDLLIQLRILAGAFINGRHELDTSIAQGLKQDALRAPTAPVASMALDMLDPETGESGYAKFWFSRVLLVQAIALRSIEGDSDSRADKLIEAAQRDEHQFVQEAARLCKRALDKRQDSRRYIWEDLTHIVSRTPQGLAVETTQLVADIVIALNLNEQRDARLRGPFYEAAQLPYCLSESNDRAELLGTEDRPSDCSFALEKGGDCQLCPYKLLDPARRELSKAFCRHQRLVARPLRWHPSLSTSALKGFWKEMEFRARM